MKKVIFVLVSACAVGFAGCSPEVIIPTLYSNGNGAIDIDGNSYNSLVYNNGQEWFGENLRTTTYSNGDPIPNVTDGNQWDNLNSGAWVHYNNDSQYDNLYGKLYNYSAVNDPPNVCPSGWHVPADWEWSALINYLDPTAGGGEHTNTVGKKMKSTGTQYWQSPNKDATNESGFSGLPGGYRSDSGSSFLGIGIIGYWWSSSTSGYPWIRYLHYNNPGIIRTGDAWGSGLSVRCLRD